MIQGSLAIKQVGRLVLGVARQNTSPYGQDLLIYNFAQKKLYSLTDAGTARQYFKSTGFVPEKYCSPGYAWGWNDR
jgi:hypothetical protein